MILTIEQSRVLSDFLNKSEDLSTAVAVFAEELKAEVLAEEAAAKAAAEAEAERMAGLTDAEVVAEAGLALSDTPAEAAPQAVEDVELAPKTAAADSVLPEDA